jgi:K(+)-stimulated pyrophosphate-energized sodium pump
MSSLPSLIGIGAAAMGSYYICKPSGGYPMFGIALAALGMLSVVG